MNSTQKTCLKPPPCDPLCSLSFVILLLLGEDETQTTRATPEYTGSRSPPHTAVPLQNMHRKQIPFPHSCKSDRGRQELFFSGATKLWELLVNQHADQGRQLQTLFLPFFFRCRIESRGVLSRRGGTWKLCRLHMELTHSHVGDSSIIYTLSPQGISPGDLTP